MATRSGAVGAGGERMVHQDFIARIRFSNALPPPPIPPKLLDIPNTGLSNGQYTGPSFATRLFREQPVNIEADAELGMPLDLVGMPGVFDGDESSIQAPAHAPPIHPHDRPLLRPLSTLGKPKVSETSVSFLRRTEYISSVQARKAGGGGGGGEASVFVRSSSGNSVGPLKRPEKRKAALSPELDKDSPAYIKRKIDKGFEFAAASLKDRSRIRHPTKRNAKLVDAYPMLPDLDAFPDSGAYVTVKFANNPVAGSATYDTRLQSGVFRPIARTQAEEDAFQAALAQYASDPEHHAKPFSVSNWNLYLPDTAGTASNFQQKYDVHNPGRDAEALYTATSSDVGACFPFTRVRAYETAEEVELDQATKYDREILFAFTEPARVPLAAAAGGKAVLYYPVMQRSTIRSQRTRNIARSTAGVVEPEPDTIEVFEVTVQDPAEDMAAQMRHFAENPLGFLLEEQEEEQGGAGAREDGEEVVRATSQVGRRSDREGSAAVPNGDGNYVEESVEVDERDAEGEAEGDEEE